MSEDELQGSRVERIAAAILEAVLDNYKQGPLTRHRTYEALNACAGAVAQIIVGCGAENGIARSFFEQILQQNIDWLVSHEPQVGWAGDPP